LAERVSHAFAVLPGTWPTPPASNTAQLATRPTPPASETGHYFEKWKKLARDLGKQVEYEKKSLVLERMSMTVLEQKPLLLSVPLREEPKGVLRVGKSRVLLELVIHAHQRGAAPQDIVRMYDTLDLGDVYAVIAYYLAHPAEIDEYLRKCDEQAEAIRRQIESSQPPRPNLKQELLARAKERGLNL